MQTEDVKKNILGLQSSCIMGDTLWTTLQQLLFATLQQSILECL